jgi:LmbE family N-acetylglucosaminyl deacetylase
MKTLESKLVGKRLALVIAHPDDESFLAAGTIDKNYHAGGKNFIICATFGEQGKSRVGGKISSETLRKIRAQELNAVCNMLHVRKHFGLGLPDGAVESHTEKLNHLLTTELKKIKPDCVISFGKDGVSGHKDHIAAGKIARQCAEKLMVPFAAFVVPSTWHASLLKKRRHGKYIAKLFSSKPNLTISINSKVKLAAIKLHSSQVDEKDPLSHFPDPVKKDMLRREYFLFHKK